MNIQPLTDSALLLTFGGQIDISVNRRVHALAAHLTLTPLEGILEFVPSYASLSVLYDPLALDFDDVSDWVLANLEASAEALKPTPRQIDVPVIYDGPDLDEVAKLCGLGVSEIIRLHTGTVYTVFMMGFTPGFPYMGSLPLPLRVPRLKSPRAAVPAGSVAIAGQQTGIYPLASPGGWRLIGHTEIPLLDLRKETPFLFSPGDAVRFIAV